MVSENQSFLDEGAIVTPLIGLVLWLISTNGDGDGFPNGFLYYAGFSTGTETDSNPLIHMYGIGTEICPWDGDPSLKWVQ